jgi:CDP-diacylglycerol--glycerol-3-phosphate 3-phosphatidyltransferase
MITKLVRRYTKWITEPIARFFIRLGASPDHITVLGLLLMVGVAAVLALGYLRPAGFLILIAAGADGVDGVMARMQGRSTKFGAFLDSTLDRYSEAVTLVGLFIYFVRQGDSLALLLIYVAIVGSLMVSYTRARAESLGLECRRGFLTRVERVILLMLALIVGQVQAGLWLLAILSQLTAIQRIYWVWRTSRTAEPA